jgi:hypothetical protein
MAGTIYVYRVLQPAAVAKAENSVDDPIMAQVQDASKHAELVKMFQELPPEVSAYYIVKLEASLKKRKLQLTGYLVALAVWLVGMFLALAYYGAKEGFTGWIFLVPFAAVGAILWLFGKWSDAVGNALGEPPEAVRKAQAAQAGGTPKGSGSKIKK